ncbi:hypothetical protein FB2170_14308 [Maribacter sp. HTCC2170]|nr:hypothetical protein FB2170_14308 [Maribacter sp. HTCC2170]
MLYKIIQLIYIIFIDFIDSSYSFIELYYTFLIG